MKAVLDQLNNIWGKTMKSTSYVVIENVIGDLTSNLTRGKLYEAQLLYASSFMISDDNGDKLMIIKKNCPHLNGGSWGYVRLPSNYK